MVGLPGAGKTTRALVLAEQHGAVRFNPDEWMADLGIDLFDEAFRDRLEQRMLRLTAELLTAGGRVVIEFGSWSRAERDHLLALARRAGARVELHVLDPDADELWRRLAERNTRPGGRSSTGRPSPGTCSTGRHPTPKNSATTTLTTSSRAPGPASHQR